MAAQEAFIFSTMDVEHAWGGSPHAQRENVELKGHLGGGATCYMVDCWCMQTYTMGCSWDLHLLILL